MDRRHRASDLAGRGPERTPRRAAAAGGLLAVLATIGIFGLAQAAAQRPPSGHGDPGRNQAAVQDAGRSLYVQHCAACHGPAGEGTTDGPPLIGAGAAAADFYLRTGRMPLPAPDQPAVAGRSPFSPDEIAALVAFVASLGPGPAIPTVRGGGDVGRGWQIYQANCAACHAATGAGNAVGGGYVAVGLQHADPVTVAEAITIGPGVMPRFDFDSQQLEDAVAYVQYLRNAPTPGGIPIGGVGPVGEGLVAVGIALPLLVLLARFVGRQSHEGEPDIIPRPLRRFRR